MTEERRKLIEAAILVNEVIESIQLKQLKHVGRITTTLKQVEFDINQVVIRI